MRRPTVRIIITLSLVLGVPASHASCEPSRIGAPCGQGGLAVAGHMQPALNLAAGNPVHLVTGNKYQRDVDLPANPAAPGIELIRHYNAMDVRASVLGQGWALSYDTRLFRVPDGWQIVQADGGRIDFPDSAAQPDGSHRNGQGRLDHVHQHHNWFWASGTTLRFDQTGRLVAIRWPSGESVHILRHADASPLRGAISKVQNDRGQTLSFHYAVEGQRVQLESVETPLGRFNYTHDVPARDAVEHSEHVPQQRGEAPHRLVRVTRPDGMHRHYLYEAPLQAGHPYALTGIEIGTGTAGRRVRTNTWAYDDQGRATRSVAGDPQSGRNHVALEYRQSATNAQPGLTVVTNGQRQKTVFHTALRAGRHVLTKVEGAGCPGCAAPGTRARYDDAGRLTHINGTEIRRRDSGAISTLRPATSGWPGLTLSYGPDGMRDRWQSDVTGTETMRYNTQGLPVERRFANGDTAAVEYDIQHRPVTVNEKHGNHRATTRLHWYGNRLARIEHPGEVEARHYDEQGRVSKREITRASTEACEQVSFAESFRYDKQHRLVHHTLPEGGSLLYEWGQGPQLKSIYWQDINGTRHKIIDTVPTQAGYGYGNGLHLHTAADAAHRVRRLQLRDPDAVLWTHDLHYDDQQRVSAETTMTSASAAEVESALVGKAASTATWRYSYDQQSRLIGWDRTEPHVNASTETGWLAWRTDGSAAAIRTGKRTLMARQQRDAAGLVRHADDYDLEYDSGRRLSRVMRDGRTIARYQHNAFGYRITRHGSDGTHSHYFYLNNQRVAQADHTPAQKPLLVTRRYIYAHHVPVAIIDYARHARAGQMYFVHADQLGAPRLVTDTERRIRWQAEYSPLGHARQTAGDLQLDLRLPGQFADPDTGWHDNLLRTYVPQWGHYLEPDPLGPLPGNQAYGYAAQQPRRYSDPMGLLLFAFDGTRQSADTRSNVWKLSQYYLDGPVHYHSGPGNSMFINWDALTAHQARQIIDTQWKWLLLELSRTNPAEVTPIDILGFSRGAALARHFGNLISQHVDQGLFRFDDPFYGSISSCVDLRFMGLFDTVAQFGVGGSQNRNYDLTIAPAWEWVAHAVALHERRWLFPLTSASDNGGYNVVEAPFIGAHSDIGGGVLPDNRGQPGGRGDLSDVALNWMLWQARAASVRFGDLDDSDRSVTNPVLHDFRSTLVRQIQDGDRSVHATAGGPLLNYQDDHPRLGRTLREQTEQIIRRAPDWQSDAGVEVGTVDMDGYARWLRDELGWHAVPV